MEIRILNKADVRKNSDIFYGPKGIFKKIGTEAVITDFSILLGGIVHASTKGYTNQYKDRVGNYWLDCDANFNTVAYVKEDSVYTKSMQSCEIGCRPAVQIIFDGNKKGYGLFEYGEFPQDAVGEEEQKQLEALYKAGNLIVTGAKYTVNDIKNSNGTFSPLIFKEYEFNNRKFVRVKAQLFESVETLSTGQAISDDDYVWVEVKPITWIQDYKNNIMFTEKIILTGIRFHHLRHYDGDFKTTDLYKYLNTYFEREIVQPRNYEQQLETPKETTIDTGKKTVLKESNPYNLVFDEVSEEDIIKACVLSGITPYLHGKSSEGKSARVKQLDKDCEIIYLRTATPESLNGKSVYNQETGEMIDVKPTWLKKLEEKCEKEPDKIHILFLDELANALPAIQSMAFNLILDKEVDGKWKLPENARIVAAGNEVTDSVAANELAEPLFNRLAHVYIKTTVEDWLKWASTPDSEYEKLDLEESKAEAKIHPAIYAFISYKRDKALRTEYNGVTPNADPRKWELASKVLYQTKNPEMLRALIGEDLTKEFVSFCNAKVITLEDVLNDRYNSDELNLDPGEKYATVVALSYVDEENLEKVREFVKYLEPEYLALFDSLWTHGDETRLEIIAEIIMRGGINK